MNKRESKTEIGYIPQSETKQLFIFGESTIEVNGFLSNHAARGALRSSSESHQLQLASDALEGRMSND